MDLVDLVDLELHRLNTSALETHHKQRNTRHDAVWKRNAQYAYWEATQTTSIICKPHKNKLSVCLFIFMAGIALPVPVTVLTKWRLPILMKL